MTTLFPTVCMYSIKSKKKSSVCVRGGTEQYRISCGTNLACKEIHTNFVDILYSREL